MSAEFVIDAYLEAVKNAGSMVGPVFFRLFSKYTSEFVSKKLGETPPQLDSLEQVKGYLVDVSNKRCETPLEAMHYVSNAMACGVCQAEAYIQGAMGPISRRVIRSSVEGTMSLTGLMEEAGKVDAYTGARKFLDVITTTVQYFNPNDVSLERGGNNKLIFDITHCPGSEVCRLLQSQGIKRVIGEECQILSMLGLSVEFLIRKTVDYKVLSKQLGASDCKMKGNILVT
jgi:hypothetical protein